MKPTLRMTVAAVLVAATLGVTGGIWWARGTTVSRPNAPATDAATQRQPLYWYDPMVPAQHFDKPGKSPYMDMALVPRYADDADAGAGGVRIDPRLAQNLGIRLASVERRTVSGDYNVPGVVAFNGRDVAVVQARAGGFVSRVYAHAPGDLIGRQAPIVDLLVPEWAAAQQEFLALLGSQEPALIAAARQRLMLAGMPPDLVAAVESTRQAHPEVTLFAPLSGVLDTLDIRAGMTVNAGATLATIRSIDPVWIEAALPDSVVTGRLVGKEASIESAAVAGRTFRGRIVSVLPQANADTHTLRVRIELPNPDGLWRPGLFAQVKLNGPSAHALLVVPSEALIHTGTRDLVIVAHPGSQFEPTEVRIGLRYGEYTAIVSGLREGQLVVASGQFLIDSEASVRGFETRMRSAPAKPDASGATP